MKIVLPFFMNTLKQKVLIVGSSGFLGYHLALALREEYFVAGISFRNYSPIQNTEIFPLDPKKLDSVDMIVRSQKPDFVINAAGIQNHTIAKENGKLSDSLNSLLPVSLAVASGRMKSKFIHINCTAVYDGDSGNYKEDSNDLALTSEFGKQKIAAESFIKAQTMESTILRVGKVMGIGQPHQASLFDLYRTLLSGTENIEASTKSFDSYLSTLSLCAAIREILSAEIPNRHRIFNLGGPRLSERDFLEGWANLITKNTSSLKNKPDDIPRDHSVSSALFEKTYPNWKQEKARTLYENLWQDFFPAYAIPNSQKSRLNNYFPPA